MLEASVGIICLLCGIAWGLWFGYYRDTLCSRIIFIWGFECYKWKLINAIADEFGDSVKAITTEKQWLHDRHEQYVMRVLIASEMPVDEAIEKQNRVDRQVYLKFPARIRSRLMWIFEHEASE